MKLIKILLLISIAFLSTINYSVHAEEKQIFSTTPKNNDGKKWRIAYYEGGPYIDYQLTLKETIRGLIALGWIEVVELPVQTGEETKALWEWLATTTKSEYIEFVKDAHYSADWDEASRISTAAKVMDRLNNQKDIDLLIAMGSWAGKDFANEQHSTPTLIFSASDPLSAGIIKSADDSGFDHIHASFDPFVYERQVKVFEEMIGFSTLGIAYEDTVDGRSYAAIDIVEKVAKERGFKVIKCYTISDIGDAKAELESVKKCFHTLAKETDAIYVTQQGGVRLDTLSELVEITNEHRIPTFSQAGSEEVKLGFLASISQAGFAYFGQFNAKTMAKVLNGAKPNQLNQIFEQPPKIAINLKTAEIIGFDPPIIILGAADEIFHEIVKPKKMGKE